MYKTNMDFVRARGVQNVYKTCRFHGRGQGVWTPSLFENHAAIRFLRYSCADCLLQILSHLLRNKEIAVNSLMEAAIFVSLLRHNLLIKFANVK